MAIDRMKSERKGKKGPGVPSGEGPQGPSPEAPGQFLLDDRRRPQPRGNHDRVGGRLPPHHREWEICHHQQYRSPPDDRGGEAGGTGLSGPDRSPGTRSRRPRWSGKMAGGGPWGATCPSRAQPCWRRRSHGSAIPSRPEELDRYRWLGEKVSAALEKTLIDDEARGRRNRRSWEGSATNCGKTGSIRSR